MPSNVRTRVSVPPYPLEYSVGEEVSHALTHGIGALFSLAGMLLLVVRALSTGKMLSVLACVMYGASLTLLYLASTLYHAVPPKMPRLKQLFKTLDHLAIYLFIAGSYTPIALVAMSGTWRVVLFGSIWGLAIMGVMLQVTRLRKYKRLGLALYLMMGWLAIVVIKPLLAAVSMFVVAMLIAGGIAYTVGVVFYLRDQKWSHTVWHGFVLVGSVLHFVAVASIMNVSLVQG
jgi:hemolysin III